MRRKTRTVVTSQPSPKDAKKFPLSGPTRSVSFSVSYPPKLNKRCENTVFYSLSSLCYSLEASVNNDPDYVRNKTPVKADYTVTFQRLFVYIDDAVELAFSTGSYGSAIGGESSTCTS